MRRNRRDISLLRYLSAMPFQGQLELALVSKTPDRTTYDAVVRLEKQGFVASIRHATHAITTTHRRQDGFAKRVWRLMEEPYFGLLLVLIPDQIRLRHAQRLLYPASATILVTEEANATRSTFEDKVWHLRSMSTP